MFCKKQRENLSCNVLVFQKYLGLSTTNKATISPVSRLLCLTLSDDSGYCLPST